MTLSDLTGKRVAIIGQGKEGCATKETIEKYVQHCDISLRDMTYGKDYLDDLESFDVIIKSPGVPYYTELQNEDVEEKIISPTLLFLSECKERDCMVIGITGTKGKSTVSSLINHILSHAVQSKQSPLHGTNSFLVGNIGIPAISSVKRINTNTIFVHELSSFQLEDRRKDPDTPFPSPHIAVMTSFYPEHIEHHGGLEKYRNAKANIVRGQSKNDHIVLCKEAQWLSAYSQSTIHQSEDVSLPFSTLDLTLKGEHNTRNIKAALCVARILHIPDDISTQAIASFQPLPHRMQSLGIHHGIEWIDDSISTIQESSIAAIKTFTPRISSIILGGQDRGQLFDSLAEHITHSPIDTVILLGETAPRIEDSLKKMKRPVAIHHAQVMADAVSIARTVTPHGKICLLSPACPSFDLYSHFEERGHAFASCIREKSVQSLS